LRIEVEDVRGVEEKDNDYGRYPKPVDRIEALRRALV
jgi:hypothetical protein